MPNADGSIAYFMSDDYPPVILFERLRGLRGSGWLQPLLYTALGLCVVASLAWCWMIVRRRRLAPHEIGARARRWWIISRAAYSFQCCVWMGWLILLFSGLSALSRNGSLVPLMLLRVLSLFVVAAALPAIANIVAICLSRAVTAKRFAIEAVFAGAATFLAWFALSYAMVSFSTSL